jgi:endonuclease/exonuclease/phosphatase (EEP) superfamily protein YafD
VLVRVLDPPVLVGSLLHRNTAARALAVLPVLLTLLPLSRTGRGWVRIWDFPRAQITALGLVATAAMARWGSARPADRLLTAALGAALAYQATRMAPYTLLYQRQVPWAVDPPPDRCIRLLMANVLQENRRSDLVLSAIRDADPDVVCLVETDRWWSEAMRPLERDYPWVARCPLDNHYGMLLLSRLRLATCDIRSLVSADVPSIRATIVLRSGDEVVLYAVHPPPPLPDTPSYGRDAELVLTGQEIAGDGRPAIVVGDLNDVAWSYTATLFQRVSHMLDPRVGRGTFNTFHARHPLARYPLDHVFHTRDFSLKALEVLRYTGSDHFPILVELALTPARQDDRPRPEPTASDRENAGEMLEQAGLEPAPASESR